jgi:hypothetical protein
MKCDYRILRFLSYKCCVTLFSGLKLETILLIAGDEDLDNVAEEKIILKCNLTIII